MEDLIASFVAGRDAGLLGIDPYANARPSQSWFLNEEIRRQTRA